MRRLLLSVIFTAIAFIVSAQEVDPGPFNGLHWRLIGPFRGGRALAVSGVPGQPEKFYFGAVGGGVWVTGNAGRTWTPIFDSQPMASIGAIAVAPSDPNIVYVGTGEADMRSDIQQGNGVYKSVDAGKTWSHIGLEDSRQIGKIVIDPKDAGIMYVAALGHQYGPNAERGVFKSIDGGKTWSKSLYKNQDTGAIDLAMDPSDSNVIFAAMWQTRRPPWSIYPPSNGPASGLYKSTDAGATWAQIRGHGFPAKTGRIGITISPADHSRVYACIDGISPKDGGVYRSDDGGATWSHTATDPRIWGRGWYFMGITADPKTSDTVYVMNTSAYRSTDGGRTFIPFKGAPGGDDYHTCWIDPENASRMALASDQGTVISVDGGTTWSSWYNQPTGQFYHVIADNRFPYWVYGAQQDSGAMAVPSRTIHTGMSAVYQRPIDAGGESGTIAPDPLHPGMLFSSTGSKEDISTGWEQSIDPTLLRYEEVWRSEWTQPIAVSPVNPHVFYTSHQKVFRTSDGGSSWRVISPDLTRPPTPALANLDAPTVADNDGTARRGVVYWLAPSPVRPRLLWAGTDDGLIWLTNDDGVHWSNVTPSALTPWSKVGVIDASHFSVDTAYAAIDRHRLDDNRPFIYRTHDGGKHWKLIVSGIPADQFVNVVREDPRRRGLLYAGTDWGVFVSFDDGDHWQSIQLNLPAASVRDIVFGGNDVIVGTHGRAVWILDDPAPLRQSPSGFFRPSPAVLFQRAGTFGFGRFDEGTPYPPEEPQGENPPWGAVLDYVVPTNGRPVLLEVDDSGGKLIRRISSADKPQEIDRNRLDIPGYWITSPQTLSGTAGGHRYVWDLRCQTPDGPLVPPGRYVVRMTIGGRNYRQPLAVVRDPRLHVRDAELRSQFKLAMQIRDEMANVKKAREKGARLMKGKLSASVLAELQGIMGTGPVRRRRRSSTASQDFSSLNFVEGALGGLFGAVESAPAAPTIECLQTFARLKKVLAADVAAVRSIERKQRIVEVLRSRKN